MEYNNSEIKLSTTINSFEFITSCVKSKSNKRLKKTAIEKNVNGNPLNFFNVNLSIIKRNKRGYLYFKTSD